ncbi:MAG TPA: hypothetical protein VK324_12640 [Tepidisphaeraceae bacterium]|nr:hypothetical protein [Tepidisphaeraceae bacterium]
MASQTAELVGTLPADGLVVLDPPAWLGRRFPLGPHTRQLSARSDLATGEWDVLLYHWDCGACRATLAWLGGRGDGPAVVAVQAPPLAPAGEDPAGLHARIVRGHLDEGREWFVAAPVLVSVRDGVVTAVRSRDELPK